MQIQAELDEIHSERLIQLQQYWQKPIPEVLATLIDLALAQTTITANALPEPMSIGQWQNTHLSRESLYNDDGR